MPQRDPIRSRLMGSEDGDGSSTGRLEVVERLWLADWRRRIATLYADVRRRAADDPEGAWNAWRGERERLYREHPQSPIPAAERAAFRARYWPYDPALRLETTVMAGPAVALGDEPASQSVTPVPMSVGEALPLRHLGHVAVHLPIGDGTLEVFALAGYAGGLFLPFRDETNGRSTYAAGRYLLDTAKGADLGGDPATGRLVLDFNFAYHPSCAFDPRWSCPLAPPGNRLDQPVEAGERLW